VDEEAEEVTGSDCHIGCQQLFDIESHIIPVYVSGGPRSFLKYAVRCRNQQHNFQDHIDDFVDRFILVIFLLFEPLYHGKSLEDYGHHRQQGKKH
jgi:hypothetical protein